MAGLCDDVILIGFGQNASAVFMIATAPDQPPQVSLPAFQYPFGKGKKFSQSQYILGQIPYARNTRMFYFIGCYLQYINSHSFLAGLTPTALQEEIKY